MFKRAIFSITLLSIICPLISGQECAPPKITAAANSTNLFTPEQEMILGEIAVQGLATEVRIIHDDRLLEYINDIGQRLIKHLPPTGLRFQFHLVDIPSNNAFNIPGGHVFISRKLIGFARSEDELAGVIAHELGHATVRHGAVSISQRMRDLLHITSLGDRKDIIEKYNLLIEKARTKNSSSRNQSDEHQLEADKIGLFAMTAAGYDPSAFSSFFDRLAETGGKTGNWFSDLFGSTNPDQKRLREMIQLSAAMPAGCRDGRSTAKTDTFVKWQADVVSARETSRKEDLPGLVWKKDLAPKLRSDVSHLAFSSDGKYLLLQDDFAVTIVARDNLNPLFQIPVDGANAAAFTLDGKQIIFVTSELRFERWSIAEQKLVEVRELTTRRSCWEHALSPDGNYLGCVDTSGSVNILDTKTGKRVWEKKEFYRLNYFEYIAWLDSGRTSTPNSGFFRIEFSPDSHFVMFSRSDRYTFRLKVNGLTADETDRTAMAVDLSTLQPVGIGGDIRKLSGHAFTFIDSGRILGLPSSNAEDGGIFAFPSGKRLTKFPFYARELEHTANNDYLIMKPLVNASLGVFDLKKGTVVAALNKQDATMWNNLLVYESVAGKVLFRQVAYNEKEKTFDLKDFGAVDVPVSSIRNLRTVDVSDDFSWMLFSSGTRGGLWDLRSGERKIYLRGFRGSAISNDGKAVADFPKYQDTKHSLVVMDPTNNIADPLRELPESGSQQYGRFVLTRRSLKENPKAKDNGKTLQRGPQADDQSDPSELRTNVSFEIRDTTTDRLLWSRDFPNTAPSYSLDKYSGRMIFYWQLGSDAGKAKLKEVPELQTKASSMDSKSDDYLVEVIDTQAQKTVGMILLDTGRGSFDISRGRSDRDWLVFHDSEGRELVYSISDGTLRHRFFGRYAILNPKKDQIAIENFPGEINLFDLASGEPQYNYVISGNASYLRFNPEGNRLFVLSDSQASYVFNLNK